MGNLSFLFDKDIAKYRYKMKKIICFIFITFSFYSCFERDNSTIYIAIDKYYKNHNLEDTIKVNLREITHFSWDYLYFFSYSATKEEIDTILGIDYGFYEEFSDKFIFIKNNKVLSYETIPLKFKGIDPDVGGSLVFFSMNNDKNYVLIDKNNSTFIVTKELNRFNEVCYYLENIISVH